MNITPEVVQKRVKHASNSLGQFWATFEDDRAGVLTRELIGVDRIMWGSDYPHTDGIWPESSKYIEEQFAGLPADVVHKITCENAAKFYRLVN